MTTEPMTQAFVAVGVGAGLLLLRRFIPPRLAKDGPTLEVLQREFGNRWDAVATLVWLGSVGLIGYGLYRLLMFAFEWQAGAALQDVYYVGINPLALLLPAGFLAMSLAPFVAFGVLFLLLGDRYDRFLRYTSLKAGFDATRVCRSVLTGFAVLFVPALFLMLDCYAAFSQDFIYINRLMSVGSVVRKYDEVEAIYWASHSRASMQNPVVDRPRWCILFKNGEVLASKDPLRRADPATDRPMLEFVAEKSGIKVKEVPLLPQEE
ncbi:MAG: hypothetical protein NTY65_17450 [Planctomycetota bacterium]|nr:hypothetical protein [Planctomycetota bacterium]